jgi:predicted Zn-dependent protease with MMP-like domain
MDRETLVRWAEEELAALREVLPVEVRDAAERCLITLEAKPGLDPDDEGLIGDELGVFEGACLLDDPGLEDLPRIRLFLENLWEWVEQDEQDYRDEVGTTFLHELGHYLGWDEDDVAERGLE